MHSRVAMRPVKWSGLVMPMPSEIFVKFLNNHEINKPRSRIDSKRSSQSTMSRSASFTMFTSSTMPKHPASLNTKPSKSSSRSQSSRSNDHFNDDYFADDLSRVRTTIPRVVKDAKSGDHAFVICLEKSKEDDNFERHEQLRFYAEFYALESKLKGFFMNF